MKDEYDFSNGTRGAVVDSTGKTRITIFLDDDILAAFRERASQNGKGYQTLINNALRVAFPLNRRHSPLRCCAKCYMKNCTRLEPLSEA